MEFEEHRSQISFLIEVLKKDESNDKSIVCLPRHYTSLLSLSRINT